MRVWHSPGVEEATGENRGEKHHPQEEAASNAKNFTHLIGVENPPTRETYQLTFGRNIASAKKHPSKNTRPYREKIFTHIKQIRDRG